MGECAMKRETHNRCPALGASWLLLIPILAWAYAGCTRKAAEADQRAVIPVLAAEASARDMPLQITAFGTVVAYATVSVKTLVSGALDQVHFTEGQEVQKGALLFTIDPRPFQTDLQRAQANLDRDTAQLRQAEANVAREQANALNAAGDRRRYEILVQKGVAPRQQLDQAIANADASEAAVRADQAAVETAREAIRADTAAIEAAQLNLAYCYVRSPIAGRTGSLLVNRGNIIKSNDTTLVVINQVHPIYVSFAVPEQELALIRKYSARGRIRVEASVPAGSGAPAAGELTFLDNTVNPSTGTIQLKATFDNQADRLWPGLFVNVTVTLAVQPDVVVVPGQAVQTGQQGSYVFVVKPDMTIEMRTIAVERVVGELAIVAGGLRAGETVVTDGQIRLVPGARVQIKKSL